MGSKSHILTSEKAEQVHYRIKRRHFLLGMAALSASALIPTAISCSATPIHDIHNELSDEDFLTLTHVQSHLFPKTKTAPGAEDIYAATYFTWVLGDPEKDPRDTKRMREGIVWVKETSQELYGKPFTDLSKEQKEKVLRQLEQKSKGQNWLSITLTTLFEALFSDPIYGSNTESMGWNWVDHQPGIPRPTEQNKYSPKW